MDDSPRSADEGAEWLVRIAASTVARMMDVALAMSIDLERQRSAESTQASDVASMPARASQVAPSAARRSYVDRVQRKAEGSLPPALAGGSMVAGTPSVSEQALDGVQAKAEVGAVDDPLEREADAVADTVVSGGKAAHLISPVGGEKAQRKGDGNAAGAGSLDQAVAAGGGAPLDERTRGKMETGFGRDLSSVRVHTGGGSDAASKEIGAQAFTAGQNIHFADGKYHPGSSDGDRLIAHEITHTVQQSGGGVVRRSATPHAEAKPPTDPVEWARFDYARPLMHDDAGGGNLYHHIVWHGPDLPLYAAEMIRLMINGDKSLKLDPNPGALKKINENQDWVKDLRWKAAWQDYCGQNTANVIDQNKNVDTSMILRSLNGPTQGSAESEFDRAKDEQTIRNLQSSGKMNQAVAQSKNDFATNNLGRALLESEQDGAVNVDQVLQNRGPGWSDVLQANELAAQAELNQAIQQLKDAKDKVKKLDCQLAIEIHQVGPGVTNPNEFIARFRAEHDYQTAKDGVASATSHLSATLAKDGKILDAFGANGGNDLSGQATSQMVSTYLALASSPDGAISARDWADRTIKNKAHEANYAKDLPSVQAVKDKADETISRTAMQELTDLLAEKEAPDKTKQIMEAIERFNKKYLNPLHQIESIRSLAGVAPLFEEFRTNLFLHSGKPEDVKAYLAVLEKASKEAEAVADPLVRKMCGGVLSMISMYSGASEVALKAFNGKGLQSLVGPVFEFREATHQFLELFSKEEKVTKDSAAYLKAFDLVETKGRALNMLMPGVSIFVNGKATWDDLSMLREKGVNPAEVAVAVGDLTATIGSVLEVCPVTAPLGEAIALVGGAISSVAGMFVHYDTPAQVDEKRVLGDMGLGKSADILSSNDATDNMQLAQKFGMTAKEIDALAADSEHRRYLDTKGGIEAMQSIQKFLDVHGLQSMSLYQFLMSCRTEHVSLQIWVPAFRFDMGHNNIASPVGQAPKFGVDFVSMQYLAKFKLQVIPGHFGKDPTGTREPVIEDIGWAVGKT